MNVQKDIIEGKHDLIWSFILGYENEQNPFDMRKSAISEWRGLARSSVALNDNIFHYAETLLVKGIKEKDALHIACAVEAKCEVFLTTDRKLLNTRIEKIEVMSPIDFVSRMEE